MNIHRWKWRSIAVIAIVMLLTGSVLAVTYRNKLSPTTLVGHWQGYALQTSGYTGHTVVTKVPIGFTFRPNGICTRDYGLTPFNYEVCDVALVFYNIRDRNALPRPVLWNARIVGNTLTLGGSDPVAVLRREQ